MLSLREDEWLLSVLCSLPIIMAIIKTDENMIDLETLTSKKLVHDKFSPSLCESGIKAIGIIISNWLPRCQPIKSTDPPANFVCHAIFMSKKTLYYNRLNGNSLSKAILTMREFNWL